MWYDPETEDERRLDERPVVRMHKWVGSWGKKLVYDTTRLSATRPRQLSVQGTFQSRWGTLKDNYYGGTHQRPPQDMGYGGFPTEWALHPHSFIRYKTNDTLWMKVRLWLRRARNRIYNKNAAGLLQSTRGNGSMSSMYNRTLRTFTLANTTPPRLSQNYQTSKPILPQRLDEQGRISWLPHI